MEGRREARVPSAEARVESEREKRFFEWCVRVYRRRLQEEREAKR